MSFRIPLPPTLSLRAGAAWLGEPSSLGAWGGLVPALRAQKLPVRAVLVWFIALHTLGASWPPPSLGAAGSKSKLEVYTAIDGLDIVHNSLIF